jgi:hypothetical protein
MLDIPDTLAILSEQNPYIQHPQTETSVMIGPAELDGPIGQIT